MNKIVKDLEEESDYKIKSDGDPEEDNNKWL